VSRSFFQILGLLGLCACAGSQTGASSAPILELGLTAQDGRRFELSASTGKPRLLFLFATYDEASQFAIVPLMRLAETQQRVQIIGLALQPDAKTFIKLFKEALSVPFQLFYDADNQLLKKQTALGSLRGIPAIVALDVQDRIRAVHYGAASQEQLEQLIELLDVD
jgi:peroxiredoxin